MQLFACEKPLVGMIHLPALPGSPRYDGRILSEIVDLALQDLEALETGGADGTIVENIGDAPFTRKAGPETIAAMTMIVQEIMRKARNPVGVNVLRNDGLASLSIAAATGTAFIRVNVFCGVAFTDQGIVEGEARALHDLRRRLGTNTKILADVHVKHAAHLTTIEEAALDAARNLPDGLIVTGIGTGKRTPPENLDAVKQLTCLPVFVGSGVRLDNLSVYHDADGFIVGTTLKATGRVEEPVDRERVAALAEAVASLRDSG